VELRPLSLREIFDRAFALYARSFVAFAASAAAFVVPATVAQHFIALRAAPQLETALNALQRAQTLGTPAIPPVFTSPQFVLLALGGLLIGWLTWAFVLSAVGAGVAQVYRGNPVSARDCLGGVAPRSGAILALSILELLALAGFDLAAGAVLILLVVVAVLVAGNALAALAPLVAVCAFVLMLGPIELLVVPAAFGFFAVVVEGRGAAISLRLGLLRVFTRSEFGRALRCAIVLSAIVTLSMVVTDALAFVAARGGDLAGSAIDASVRIVVNPFVALVLALYYFDVRLRHEGFDLEPGVERPALDGEPVYAPTAYLSGAQRALVKRFLARRDELLPWRRREIAAALAAPARERVPEELRSLEDEQLLERL